MQRDGNFISRHYLDPTDVSSGIAFDDYFQEKFSDFERDYTKSSSHNQPEGTTLPGKMPATMLPEKEVSPNIIDQIAWVTVHEALHKLNDLAPSREFDRSIGDPYSSENHVKNTLMRGGSALPKKSLEKWSKERFRLSQKWTKFINTNYKKRIEIMFPRGIPLDNATRRKNEDEENDNVNSEVYQYNPRF